MKKILKALCVFCLTSGYLNESISMKKEPTPDNNSMHSSSNLDNSVDYGDFLKEAATVEQNKGDGDKFTSKYAEFIEEQKSKNASPKKGSRKKRSSSQVLTEKMEFLKMVGLEGVSAKNAAALYEKYKSGKSKNMRDKNGKILKEGNKNVKTVLIESIDEKSASQEMSQPTDQNQQSQQQNSQSQQQANQLYQQQQLQGQQQQNSEHQKTPKRSDQNNFSQSSINYQKSDGYKFPQQAQTHQGSQFYKQNQQSSPQQNPHQSYQAQQMYPQARSQQNLQQIQQQQQTKQQNQASPQQSQQQQEKSIIAEIDSTYINVAFAREAFNHSYYNKKVIREDDVISIFTSHIQNLKSLLLKMMQKSQFVKESIANERLKNALLNLILSDKFCIDIAESSDMCKKIETSLLSIYKSIPSAVDKMFALNDTKKIYDLHYQLIIGFLNKLSNGGRVIVDLSKKMDLENLKSLENFYNNILLFTSKNPKLREYLAYSQKSCITSIFSLGYTLSLVESAYSTAVRGLSFILNTAERIVFDASKSGFGNQSNSKSLESDMLSAASAFVKKGKPFVKNNTSLELSGNDLGKHLVDLRNRMSNYEKFIRHVFSYVRDLSFAQEISLELVNKYDGSFGFLYDLEKFWNKRFIKILDPYKKKIESLNGEDKAADFAMQILNAKKDAEEKSEKNIANINSSINELIYIIEQNVSGDKSIGELEKNKDLESLLNGFFKSNAFFIEKNFLGATYDFREIITNSLRDFSQQKGNFIQKLGSSIIGGKNKKIQICNEFLNQLSLAFKGEKDIYSQPYQGKCKKIISEFIEFSRIKKIKEQNEKMQAEVDEKLNTLKNISATQDYIDFINFMEDLIENNKNKDVTSLIRSMFETKDDQIKNIGKIASSGLCQHFFSSTVAHQHSIDALLFYGREFVATIDSVLERIKKFNKVMNDKKN